MSQPIPPLWVAFGFDPIRPALTVLGIDATEAESRDSRRGAADQWTFRASFLMSADGFANDFYSWVRYCKVPEPMAAKVMRQFGFVTA